jgi:hypothetical protein
MTNALEVLHRTLALPPPGSLPLKYAHSYRRMGRECIKASASPDDLLDVLGAALIRLSEEVIVRSGGSLKEEL